MRRSISLALLFQITACQAPDTSEAFPGSEIADRATEYHFRILFNIYRERFNLKYGNAYGAC